MAHSCPECDQTCYCNGDIDDCEIDDPEDVAACTHCDERVEGDERVGDDDDDPDPAEWTYFDEGRRDG